MTDVNDLKNRARITPGFFQIKDALTNQVLISTHVNNPHNKNFADVIDELINDNSFAGFNVNIGNSTADARKVTYFVEGAGYNEQVAQVLNQSQTTLNGFTVAMPGVGKPRGSDPESMEEYINAKLAAYDATLQSRLLEERFKGLSRELEMRKESMEREAKLRDEYNKKMLEIERMRLEEEREKIETEREERGVWKEIGQGILSGLADIGKSYIMPKGSLAGTSQPEEPEAPRPKKPSFSMQIVNQNGASGPELPSTTVKTEAKNGADPLAYAGLSDYERKLIERLRAEDSPAEAASEVLEYLDSAIDSEAEDVEIV